jgi:hypothetical protein
MTVGAPAPYVPFCIISVLTEHGLLLAHYVLTPLYFAGVVRVEKSDGTRD